MHAGSRTERPKNSRIPPHPFYISHSQFSAKYLLGSGQSHMYTMPPKHLARSQMRSSTLFQAFLASVRMIEVLSDAVRISGSRTSTQRLIDF